MGDPRRVTQEGGVWTLEKMRVRLEQKHISDPASNMVQYGAIWYRLKESRWSWKTGRKSNPKKNEKAQEAFREDGELIDKEKRVIFTDSMRYGLIGNPCRNWGSVGERVSVPHQMEFQWGYLWAEVDLLAGELNFWLLPEMNIGVLALVVKH